jgi:DUF4097 and DUF4098 domain-containing protein YvlB
VQAEASSGGIKLSNLSGAAEARTSSGTVVLENLSGEVRVGTTSGGIRGTGLQQLRQAESSSGDITLAGVLTQAAEVRASSGDVDLRLLPGSAVRIDVRTSSGEINQRGVNDARQGRGTLSASIGSPTPDALLTIQTSSGDVTLRQ